MSRDSEQTTYASSFLRESIIGGDVPEAHPHAGIVTDDDARELENTLATAFNPDEHDDLESVEESELYQTILRNEGTHVLTDAVEAGNVSQMQFGIGRIDNSHDATDEDTRSWMRQALLSTAYVGMVIGGMGSGKTDFALRRSDEWQFETGGRVATNIQSAADRNPTVEYVGSFDDLEAFYKTSSGPAMFVLDESDQRLSDKGGSKGGADKLASCLKLIRKGESDPNDERAILLVGQTIRGAGRELRRLVTTNGHLWRKTSQKSVEVYGNVVKGEISSKSPETEIHSIPPTRLDYDTGEDSDFELPGDDGTDDKLVTIAQRMRENGQTGTEVAESLEMSEGWVYENTETPQ